MGRGRRSHRTPRGAIGRFSRGVADFGGHGRGRRRTRLRRGLHHAPKVTDRRVPSSVPMALSISPTLPVIAAQGATTATTGGAVLLPGTVLNAEVLKTAENLVQIAIANLAMDVLTEVPLTAGQTLQLAVSQNQDG